MTSNQAEPKLCRRCKDNEATHEIRTEPACGYVYFAIPVSDIQEGTPG